MASPLKKINKRIVGLVIGSALLGLSGVTSSKKGKSLLGRLFTRVRKKGGHMLDAAERLGEKIAKRP